LRLTKKIYQHHGVKLGHFCGCHRNNVRCDMAVAFWKCLTCKT